MSGRGIAATPPNVGCSVPRPGPSAGRAAATSETVAIDTSSFDERRPNLIGIRGLIERGETEGVLSSGTLVEPEEGDGAYND
jgi:hypothetical protein